MKPDLNDETLARLSTFVTEAMGLNFPPARWPDLRRGMIAAANELGFQNPAECAQWLMSAPLSKNHLQALAGHLTVGETYFFREPRSFEIFSRQILPELIRQRRETDRRLRIWSAACCTGEEPYSIAILLRQALPDWADWNITLLATDINPKFLHKAEAGVFGAWSFRNSPPDVRERYFRPRGSGEFEILPDIKRMVRFAHLNLAADVYPSLANDTNAMDVIFCRNVLMYFSTEQAGRVIRNLHRAQVTSGWLIVSPSELLHGNANPYATRRFRDAFLYRKVDRKLSQKSPPPVEPEPIVDLPRLTPINVRPVPVETPREEARDTVAEAESLYQRGRYAQAVDTIEQHLAANPNDAAALRLLARSLANLGRLDEAIKASDRWILADKLNPAAHYLRAVIAQENGLIDAAADALRRTLYLDPAFTLAHVALGNIARLRERFAEAQKHWRAAIDLLRKCRPDEVLPESDGITAARFIEIIHAMLEKEAAA